MRLVTLVLCASSLSVAAYQGPAPGDLVKREQQRVQYLESGKLDQLAAMLSPTLSYTHSSAALDSKEKFLEALRTGRVVYKALKHRDVEARLVTPDVGILNGLSDVSVTIDGKEQEVPVRFTIVYVRKNGTWLMEVWHSTRRPA